MGRLAVSSNCWPLASVVSSEKGQLLFRAPICVTGGASPKGEGEPPEHESLASARAVRNWLDAALVFASRVGEVADEGVVLVGQFVHPHHGKLDSVDRQTLIERHGFGHFCSMTGVREKQSA